MAAGPMGAADRHQCRGPEAPRLFTPEAIAGLKQAYRTL